MTQDERDTTSTRRRRIVVTVGAAIAVGLIAVAGAGLADSSTDPTTDPAATKHPAADVSTVTWRTDIPTDFPLDRGLVAPEDDPISGPGPEAKGIASPDACVDGPAPGSASWPGQRDRLAVAAIGPEFLEGRELVTLDDDTGAAAVLDGIREAIDRCGGEGDTVWTVHEGTRLGDESLTVSRTYRLGLGGDVFSFVRVGNAVLAVDLGGEWELGSTVPAGIEDATAIAADLVPEMCVFAAGGC